MPDQDRRNTRWARHGATLGPHEWSAAVYQRTLSGSGCPDCYRLEAAARSKAGRERARRARDEAAPAKVVPLRVLTSDGEAV